MHYVQQAILKTVLYADMFDCALCKREIYQKLQSKSAVTYPLFLHHLNRLVKSANLMTLDDMYVLPGRNHLFSLRCNRLKNYRLILKRLDKTVKGLRKCPWINGVLLTGSAGAQNSRTTDDIDLLIITDSNRLWLVRLWAVAVTEFYRLRRRPKDTSVTEKICLNMFLDTNALVLSVAHQNLFSAHEVIQAKTLYCKHGYDRQLLQANSWVLNYLPMSFSKPVATVNTSTNTSVLKILTGTAFQLLNTASYLLQKLYMLPKVTNEKITLHDAYFHPQSMENRILSQFETRKKQIRLI